MDKSINKIKTKRGVLLLALGGIAWLFCLIAVPVHEAHADTAYVSGCAPLVCVDRDLILNTLVVHDEEGKKSTQVALCHAEGKKSGETHTIRVNASAEDTHMKHGDTLGECADTVMQTFVASLPTCTAFVGGSTVTGVWVPENAVGHGTGLNIYFFQVQDGTCSGYPDSAAESYREIRGQ